MKKLIAVATGLLVCLPLSSQAQDSARQGFDVHIATFQQKLDAAYAEAKKETKREEAREAKWLAEMRRRGVTVQGGTTTTAAQRLLAKVEERMGLEKLALKARVERFLGMCVTEIVIGLNPLPHFSLKLRSKRPNGTCS